MENNKTFQYGAVALARLSRSFLPLGRSVERAAKSLEDFAHVVGRPLAKRKKMYERRFSRRRKCLS